MLAYSISKALDVPFIKLSLNGMTDPKVLKGFPSGYQGATLGILAEQLGKNAKNRSAVVLLDEVEKAGGEGGNGKALGLVADPLGHLLVHAALSHHLELCLVP